MKFDVNAEINTTELAAVLGITARRVQQLKQDGAITAQARGKYVLADAVQGYIGFRARERAVAQTELDIQGSEASLKKAKATIATLEAKELQGEMHRSEDVASMTEDLIYTIRGMLVALPGRLAIDAAHLTDPAEVSVLIRDEVYLVMEELSKYKYDSAKYAERVRKRRGWREADNAEGSDG